MIHRSKLTGVVTGYILLVLGIIGCNMLLAMYLQQNLKILPAITLVNPVEETAQKDGASKFKMVANEVMRKFVKNKEPQKA